MDIKSISQFSSRQSLVQPDNLDAFTTSSATSFKNHAAPNNATKTYEDKAFYPLVSHPFLGVLSTVAPILAARIGYASLAKSNVTEEHDWQKKLRESARISHTPHVQFYGGTMTMHKWGSGPTILIVNGWGERATQMAHMIVHLVSAGFRVVSFDRPPHVGTNGTATDLIEFITSIHVAAQAAGNLHAIIGHSFGAAMAMAAVRDWGDFASRHVLISPIDHRQWIGDEFGKYKALCLGVAIRMREVVDKRYGRLVDWDQLTLPELLRANHRPTLLIRDENDPATPLRSVTGAPTARLNIDYFLTSRLSPEQQHSDPAVIARVIGFLRTDEALATLARNERLC